MIIVYAISFVILILVSFIDAQSCKTPNNESGKCISIHDCKSLLDIVGKKNRTDQDVKFLRDSYCDHKDGVPTVCCPQAVDCMTPDGKPGKPVCNSREEQSVCCDPSSENKLKFMTPNERCSNSLTDLPPERDSKCCGLQTSTGNKIVGGTTTNIDEYPWLVAIEYIRLGVKRLLCGGSIISAKYVLTAGHCVIGNILYLGTPKFVRLGEYNTTNSGRDCVEIEGGGEDCTDPVIITPIEKTIPHPDYEPSHPQRRHDIALIKLKDPVPYTDFIRPICLPSMDYTKHPTADFNFFVAGWGLYKPFQNNTKVKSTVKQHVIVPYVVRDKCQESLRTVYKENNLELESGILCAGGEDGKDSCNGDSGGPLMYIAGKTFEVVGVVSFGYEECGTSNIPGAYTNVYEYLPWINNTIANVK